MKTNPLKILAAGLCVVLADLASVNVIPSKAKKATVFTNSGLIAEATKNIKFDSTGAGVRNSYY